MVTIYLIEDFYCLHFVWGYAHVEPCVEVKDTLGELDLSFHYVDLGPGLRSPG